MRKTNSILDIKNHHLLNQESKENPENQENLENKGTQERRRDTMTQFQHNIKEKEEKKEEAIEKEEIDL